MRYLPPNLDYEWREALRYREFEKMGKKGWIEVASNNYTIMSYSKIKKLKNVDLDYDSLEEDKRRRFEEAFKKGKVEIPIAVKFSNNNYDLLGGNTRLAGLIEKGIDPKLYVVDLTKRDGEAEVKETGADSSGSFEGPAFGGDGDVIKRPISKIPNFEPKEGEFTEATDASSSGQFDVPAFGKTTKGGRRDPLKIDGPDSIYKGRAVTDKKWPKFGGPEGVYVKVKEKCKRYPYCNQGNTGALDFIHEDVELQEVISEISKKYGIPHQQVENIVLNEIKDIFI
jgi:hypothetical protein